MRLGKPRLTKDRLVAAVIVLMGVAGTVALEPRLTMIILHDLGL